MNGKKLMATCAAMFMTLACCACGETEQTPPKEDPPEDNSFLEQFASLPEIRFSSIYAVEEGDVCKVKMRVPYDDTFQVSFSDKLIGKVEFYDEKGEEIASGTGDFQVTLREDQLVLALIKPLKKNVRLNISATEHIAPLPFEVGKIPSADSFRTTSDDPSVDPLEAAAINYVKRENTLYTYCNAPEALLEWPDAVNHCITRQDVSDQSVYFTMEQQSDKMNPGVYYGYRVRNTGTQDAYITVRNIGYQRSGDGSYLGEQEWIQFYNTKFRSPDLSDLTEAQLDNWNTYLKFCDKYGAPNYQPITYRIPAGEFFYVFGGTTKDAFGMFNVANTADMRVNGNCQNGAVLFDVVGKAEGAYYVYDDPAKIAPGTEGGDSHLGIADTSYHVVHTGEDVGYVVDNSAAWTFNDATPAQDLPVKFTNYYSDTAPATGEPGAEIPDITPHLQEVTKWVTNINVQREHLGVVGTDMTEFHTVGPDGKPLVVGCGYYDAAGEFANLGNWMKDYQDAFTFVNQGDRERQITVNINCNGALATLVRNVDGSVVPGTANYACQRGADGEGREAFDKAFHYTVTIPAHSVVQFVVEYNLMANSYGYVTHRVELK